MYRDKYFMEIALRIAKRALGNVFPNPAVGCVITKNDVIVGYGFTQKGGRPHAESMALNFAGDLAKDATAYVTLEPCCHYGKTNPCVFDLINSGIKRVVIAVDDPDLRVSGNGIKILRESGVEVINGLMEKEAIDINIGFFCSRKINRPFIALKIASSLDGKIALSNGKSKWITNCMTRNWVHKIRSMYDAIMVGSNTVVMDNPSLTCRISGLENFSPVRILIDRSEKVSAASNIAITSSSIKTYILTNIKPKNLIKGIKYIIVDDSNNDFLMNSMRELVKIGITRLLVEGGAKLITEMLKHDLCDRLMWCRSSKLLGGDSVSSVLNLNLANLDDCLNFKKNDVLDFGEDIVEIFDRKLFFET